MRIKNSLKAFAATALVAGAVLSASTQQSHAIPKALPYAGPAVAGKWATGSIVGIASFLAVYDIIRREKLVLTTAALDAINARLAG